MIQPVVIEKIEMPDFSPVPVSDEEAAVFDAPPIRQSLGDPQRPRGVRIVPQHAQQLAQYLALATIRKMPLRLSPDHARLMRIPVCLDVSALNQVQTYHPPDLTITVESGMRFGDFQVVLNQAGQYFPLSYPPEMLLLDIFAEDRPAPQTPFYGYPRDYVLGMEVATADGRLSHSGGQVVKNVTGYDLNKLYVGSQNTLGVMTALTLKVFPQWPVEQYYQIALASLEAVPALAQPLSGLPVSACVVSQKRDEAPRLILSLAGYSDSVRAGVQALEALVSSPHSIERLSGAPLSEIFASRIYTGLSPQSSADTGGDLIIELAPGEADLMPLFAFLTASHAIRPDCISYLPLANLVYVCWQADSCRLMPLTELQAFLDQCIQIGGDPATLRLTQVPDAFLSLLAPYNLPADPLILDWHQRLKALYDPASVLLNPYFPV